MRTDSFMSKLRNKAGAAKAAIGRVFGRKKELALGPASTSTAGRPETPPVEVPPEKGNAAPVVPAKIRTGSSYTAPKPSPATLIQRRQRKARRITRRAA